MDTQDILADVREAEKRGESENVFFLYVATSRKPPSHLHKKVIEPYLTKNGWVKVSYKNTGFRALYFLRRKNVNETCLESSSLGLSRTVRDEDDCVIISSDEDSEPSPAKRSKMSNSINDSSFILNATQTATNHRTELKRIVEKYKRDLGLTFHVHIVLSRPLDYEEDFAELEDSVEF